MDRRKPSHGVTVLSTYGQAQPRPTPDRVEHRHVYKEEKRPVPGMAVTSLVFGILSMIGFVIIGPILAFVFGYPARARIKDDAKLGGDGVAIAGITLGWISLALTLLFVVLGVLTLDMFVQ